MVTIVGNPTYRFRTDQNCKQKKPMRYSIAAKPSGIPRICITSFLQPETVRLLFVLVYGFVLENTEKSEIAKDLSPCSRFDRLLSPNFLLIPLNAVSGVEAFYSRTEPLRVSSLLRHPYRRLLSDHHDIRQKGHAFRDHLIM
jgi:hypothetical protein